MRLPDINRELLRIQKMVGQPRSGNAIVIYTTVFGDFEEALPCLPAPNGLWDTVVISDRELSVDIDCAKLVCTSFEFRNPRLGAKFFKINPHFVFPGYRYSLYVDANCHLSPSIQELLEEECSESLTALFFRHNKRDCTYDELRAVAVLGKERITRLLRLWLILKRDRYPKHNGLIQGGFILRQHNVQSVRDIMETWWQSIVDYTERDQILFDYLAWKHGFHFCTLRDAVLHESPYTHITPHRAVRFDENGRLRKTPRDALLNWYFHRYVKQR